MPRKSLYKDGLKGCRQCGNFYEPNLDNFNRHSRNSDGLTSICKNCRSSNAKADNDKPETKAKRAQYRLDHLDREYELHHTPTYLAKKSAQRSTEYGKQKRREHQNNRRSKEIGVVTKEEIDLLMITQCCKCWYCGTDLRISGYHIDHYVPISRGGLNTIENIALACPHCNLSKGSKLIEEWR